MSLSQGIQHNKHPRLCDPYSSFMACLFHQLNYSEFFGLYIPLHVLYGQSSRTLSHDFAAADPAEAMASKPSTCRNMGTWGACTQQVKNDGQPHEPGSLKGFNLLSITYTQKYLDRNPSKSTWKTLKGPEHVSELSPQFFGI